MVMVVGLFSLLAIGQLSLPSKPIKVSFIDVGGVKQQLPDPGSKATVVVFLMTDCPVANRMAPELSRIFGEFDSKKVAVRLAYVDSSVIKADVAAHQKAYGYSCPAFLDPSHRLAKRLGASISPEAVVLDSKGRLAYRGRINDLFESHGKPKAKPTVHDLRTALDEVLAGKKVTNQVVGAVGCYISPP